MRGSKKLPEPTGEQRKIAEVRFRIFVPMENVRIELNAFAEVVENECKVFVQRKVADDTKALEK